MLGAACVGLVLGLLFVLGVWLHWIIFHHYIESGGEAWESGRRRVRQGDDAD